MAFFKKLKKKYFSFKKSIFGKVKTVKKAFQKTPSTVKKVAKAYQKAQPINKAYKKTQPTFTNKIKKAFSGTKKNIQTVAKAYQKGNKITKKYSATKTNNKQSYSPGRKPAPEGYEIVPKTYRADEPFRYRKIPGFEPSLNTNNIQPTNQEIPQNNQDTQSSGGFLSKINQDVANAPGVQGFLPGASFSQKLDAGLSTAFGGGLVTKGAKIAPLTNKIAQEMLRKGLIKKGSFQLTENIGKKLAVEGAELASPAMKEILTGTRKLSFTKGEKIGRFTERTARLTFKTFKNIAKGKKAPYVALAALAAAYGLTERLTFLSGQVVDDTVDDIGGIQFAVAEAMRSGNYEEAQDLLDVGKETKEAIEEADSIADRFNMWKAGAQKMKSDLAILESHQKRLDKIREKEEKEAREKASNKQYWEDQRQHELERDQLYEQRRLEDQQFQIQMQEQKRLDQEALQQAIADRDLKLQKEYEKREKKRAKEEAKRAAAIAKRDELLRQQREAEWLAKIEEFNRQQEIFMKNWEKKQKFYADQRGSNLGFGLIG